mgnify:CR=1 FL=1
MALPKLEVPSYELELPISKKTIKFRPFLVKEQKILLMAMESGDSKSVQSAILDVLNTCILTPNFEIFNTPIVDVEYLFLHLRAKSVGEIVESKYRCNNVVDDKPCNNLMETELNLMDINVTESDVSPEIQLDDKISIKLKYPEFSIVKDSVNYDNINDVTFNMIANSIEYYSLVYKYGLNNFIIVA